MNQHELAGPNGPAAPTAVATGLTKREYIATQALAGLLANAALSDLTHQATVNVAIEMTDLLLRDLQGKEPNLPF